MGITITHKPPEKGEKAVTATQIDSVHRRAAKLVGISYLLAIPLALFAKPYVLGGLVEAPDG